MQSGVATLTAEVSDNGFTDTYQFTIQDPNPPAIITLSISNDPLDVNENAIVTVTMVDGAGQPVIKGTGIYFSVDPNDIAEFTTDPNASTLDDSGSVIIAIRTLKGGNGLIKAEAQNVWCPYLGLSRPSLISSTYMPIHQDWG